MIKCKDLSILTINGVYGRCLRNLYYSIKDPDNSLILKPQEEYLNALKYNNAIIESELSSPYAEIGFKYINGISIEGEFNDNEKYYVIATKRDITTVFGDNTNIGNPVTEHLIEVGFSLTILSQFNSAEIIYINRLSCAKTKFNITIKDGCVLYDETLSDVKIDDITERVNLFSHYIFNSVIPPCDYHPYYTINEIRQLYSERKISKPEYKYWCLIGYGRDEKCRNCEYINMCLKENQCH